MGKFGGKNYLKTLAEAQESQAALKPVSHAQAWLRAAAKHVRLGSKLAWHRSWALPAASCVVSLGFSEL